VSFPALPETPKAAALSLPSNLAAEPAFLPHWAEVARTQPATPAQSALESTAVPEKGWQGSHFPTQDSTAMAEAARTPRGHPTPQVGAESFSWPTRAPALTDRAPLPLPAPVAAGHPTVNWPEPSPSAVSWSRIAAAHHGHHDRDLPELPTSAQPLPCRPGRV
jgi:hypothetical protein